MKLFHSILILITISLSSVDARDRVALIIGVDNYQSDQIPDLDGAIRDARLMTKALEELPSPFRVTLVEDPSVNEAFDAVESFMSSALQSECAIVFFAGHGIEYHGENFLLMSDSAIEGNIETSVDATKRRLRRKMLSLNDVIDEIELTEADLKLLVLDACRNNPIPIIDGNKTRSLGSARGLARVTAPLGMLVSYSADAGQVANDGLFTEILTKNLGEPGMSVMEVFAKTREEVNAVSRDRNAEDSRYNVQLPAEYSKLSLAGIKFVFNNSQLPTNPTTPNPPVAPPTISPRAAPGETFRNASGQQMVYLSGGSFEMGDLTGVGQPDELPTQRVTLSPFYLAATEVTQSQWKAMMGEDIYALRQAAGFTGNKNYGEGPDLPAYYISYEAAVEYCRKLNDFEKQKGTLPAGYAYRLPTEAEWEYACRAGSPEPFSGEAWDLGEIATFHQAVEVGTKKSNAFGLLDMHGNVWEWCQDFYRPDLSATSGQDPRGPSNGETRVFRGGSWMEESEAARASSRGYALPEFRHRSIGLRVALAKE